MAFEIRKKTLLITSIALAMTCLFSVSAVNGLASAKDRDDLVAKQKATAQEIEQLKAQISGLDKNVQETFLKLTETKNKIPEAEAELATAEVELSAATREAQQNAALLKSAQAELSQIKEDKSNAVKMKDKTLKSLGELARANYRGDTVPSAITLIVGTSSAEDFMNSYRANIAITRSQTKILDVQAKASARAENREARQSAVESVISELKRDSDNLVAKSVEAKQKIVEKRDNLNQLQNEYTALLDVLKSKKTDIEASILARQKAQAEIAAEIAAIDAENRRLAAARANRNSGGVVITSSDWIQTPLPKPLRITQGFEYRINPISGRGEFHPAIDIGSPCGSVQRAGADGKIVRLRNAADRNPYGNAVYINHGIVNGDSWITFHAHLSRIDVSVGQSVKKGQPIGLTGTTGWSTGCHLHYEVHRNGKPINPLTLPSFR